MRTWSKEELRKFLAHSCDNRLYAAFLVGAMTGLRRGELIGLRWGDIDLEAKRLSVRRALIAPRYELQFSEPKPDAGRRLVALDDVTVAALREYRKHQAEERLAFGAGWGAPARRRLSVPGRDRRPVRPHDLHAALPESEPGRWGAADPIPRPPTRALHLPSWRQASRCQ